MRNALNAGIGIGRVAGALAKLAGTYGENRYRITPVQQRRLAAGGKFHV